MASRSCGNPARQQKRTTISRVWYSVKPRWPIVLEGSLAFPTQTSVNGDSDLKEKYFGTVRALALSNQQG